MYFPFAQFHQARPPVGYRPNLAHPLSKGLICLVPFTEGRWSSTGYDDAVWKGYRPVVYYYHVAHSITQEVPQQLSTTANSWVSNALGNAIYTPYPHNIRLFNGIDPIPSTGATIAIIRRRVTDTLNGGRLFQSYFTGNADESFVGYAPWTDNKMYFFFGGTAGDNALVTGALSWPKTPESFVFAAGSKGLSIWRNGAKLASSSNAVTRNPTATVLDINGVSGGGDDVEYNFIAIWDYQLPDSYIQSWFNAPYAMLYPMYDAMNTSLIGRLSASQGGGGNAGSGPGGGQGKGHKGGGGFSITYPAGASVYNTNIGVTLN